MEDRHSPSSLTPYISNGTFHPISQELNSEPKISSVIVGVTELDDWESAWLDCHDRHDYVGAVGRWQGSFDDYDPK